MIHIPMISGGVSSWAAGRRIVDEFGKENVLGVFCDTRQEDEDLYRFLDESIENLGIDLVTLCDGRRPWDVFEDVKYLGNTRGAPCSIKLKREISMKWVKEHYQPDECILYFGFDWSESRTASTTELWEPYKCVSPLEEKPYIDKSDIFEMLRFAGVEPPRLYAMGFSHNNCGGFCVKAGQAHFKILYEQMPDRYLYHEYREQALFKACPKTVPFLRMRINKKLTYLSLKDFRENYLDKGVTIDMFDVGGCACF